MVSEAPLSAGSFPRLTVEGAGYLVVSTPRGLAYATAGVWQPDQDGSLVDLSSGAQLLGWPADLSGKIMEAGPPRPIRVPIGKLNAVQATTTASMKGNLSAEADSAATYTAQMTVYDSLGGSHEITLLYDSHATDLSADAAAPAGATGSWNWTAYEGDVATGTVIGRSSDAGNAKIYANGNGTYVSALPAGASNTIAVPAANGTPAVPIKIDFSAIGQLKGDSQVAMGNQNGFPAGELAGYDVFPEGIVLGLFTNGMNRFLGQVALAKFAPGTPLSSFGAGLMAPSTGSAPKIGRPMGAGFGRLSAERALLLNDEPL